MAQGKESLHGSTPDQCQQSRPEALNLIVEPLRLDCVV